MHSLTHRDYNSETSDLVKLISGPNKRLCAHEAEPRELVKWHRRGLVWPQGQHAAADVVGDWQVLGKQPEPNSADSGI